MNLSLDKSDCDEFNLDSFSFDNERKVVIKDGRKKDSIYKGLGYNKREVLLEDNKYILKPLWKKDVGKYLWKVELEKSVSQTWLIVNMFLAQKNKKQTSSQPIFLTPTPSPLIFKKVEIKFERQIQAAHNLRKLLCLKI